MTLTLRPFQSGDEVAFRELNEAWIRRHFALEAKDAEVLDDPSRYILQRGGAIVMALDGSRAVGCCALLKMADGGFEIGKMTVAEDCRGLGVGKKMLAHVVELGWQMGATRLYLESNAKLPDAIHLYEAQGFRHLPAERVRRSPYARSDVYMELYRQEGER